MATTTKSRKLSAEDFGSSKMELYYQRNLLQTTTIPWSFSGYETVTSTSHKKIRPKKRVWPKPAKVIKVIRRGRKTKVVAVRPKFPARPRVIKMRETWSEGGAFKVQKIEVYPGGQSVEVFDTTYRGGYWRRWSGQVFADGAGGNFTPANYLASSTDAELDALGTLLIARAIPTNPLSSMGQFLGELKKDGIPTNLTYAWRDKALGHYERFRAGGKEWLNLQFGWAPFIKDLADFLQVSGNQSKHLAQLMADNQKLIRRKRSLPTITSCSTVVGTANSYGSPSFGTMFYDSPGKIITTTESYTKQWLSAAFTYHIPTDDSMISRLRRYGSYANYLYGLRLTPDLLWKLQPWSWAADWVFNFGSIVRNASAFAQDGLVMKYGFIMETKVTTVTTSLVGCVLKGGKSLDAQKVVVYTTKTRRVATPYGFGRNPASFSAKQWSIIGALGLAKSPTSLK